jgi:hypothetical protein
MKIRDYRDMANIMDINIRKMAWRGYHEKRTTACITRIGIG